MLREFYVKIFGTPFSFILDSALIDLTPRFISKKDGVKVIYV